MEYEEAKFLLDSKIVLEESKARREKREMVVFDFDAWYGWKPGD